MVVAVLTGVVAEQHADRAVRSRRPPRRAGGGSGWGPAARRRRAASGDRAGPPRHRGARHDRRLPARGGGAAARSDPGPRPSPWSRAPAREAMIPVAREDSWRSKSRRPGWRDEVRAFAGSPGCRGHGVRRGRAARRAARAGPAGGARGAGQRGPTLAGSPVTVRVVRRPTRVELTVTNAAAGGTSYDRRQRMRD